MILSASKSNNMALIEMGGGTGPVKPGNRIKQEYCLIVGAKSDRSSDLKDERRTLCYALFSHAERTFFVPSADDGRRATDDRR
jgi:hypothetical protein